MNYLHINVELPFQFDKQFEPIVPNENLISKFAALVDLDEVTAKKISCAFKKNSVFEKSLYGADVSGMHLLHFFAYDDVQTMGTEYIKALNARLNLPKRAIYRRTHRRIIGHGNRVQISKASDGEKTIRSFGISFKQKAP